MGTATEQLEDSHTNQGTAKVCVYHLYTAVSNQHLLIKLIHVDTQTECYLVFA